MDNLPGLMYPPGGAQLVVAKTDPVTGRIRKTAGGQTLREPIYLGRPLRVATFGDSTAEAYWTVGNVEWVQRTTDTNSFPDAAYAASGSIVINTGAAHISGHVPSIYVGDGGNGGYTTAAMLALSSDAYSATRGAITDVLSTRPDLIEYNGASVNNFWAYEDDVNGVPDAKIAEWVEEHATIVRLLTRTGIPCISLGVMGYSPQGKTEASLARQRNAVVRYNAALAARNATEGNDLWHFINPEGITCVGGAYMADVATTSNDGVHLAVAGNGPVRLGAEKAKIIANLFELAPVFTQKHIFDDVDDFANPSNGLPAGYQIGSLTDCTVTSKTCGYDKFVVEFTVTADGGGLAVEKKGNDYLKKHAEIGKTYVISGTAKILAGDTSGGVFESFAQFVQTSDTSTQLRFRRSFGVLPTNTLCCHLTSPSNGADLMDWSIVARQFTNLKAGSYRVEFSPLSMTEVA